MFGLMGRKERERERAIKISSHTKQNNCVCVCVCVTPKIDKAKLVGKRAYHINANCPRSWLRLIKKLIFYKTLPVFLCKTPIIIFT